MSEEKPKKSIIGRVTGFTTMRNAVQKNFAPAKAGLSIFKNSGMIFERSNQKHI